MNLLAQTGWRSRLRPASFRGVPFYVDTSEVEVGRKTKTEASWDYQGKVYTADLGLLPDRFTINGYIIQDSSNDFDYFGSRDRLISALKSSPIKGKDRTALPFKLVHPFYGELNVVVADACRIEESFQEGGIAKFTMHFVQVGYGFSLMKTDFVAAVDDSALASAMRLLDEASKAIRNYAQYVFYAIRAAQDIVNTIKKIRQFISAIGNMISTIVTMVTGLISNILLIVDDILDSPCDIANALKGAADQFGNLCGLGEEVVTGGVVGECSGQESPDKVIMNGETIPEAYGKSVIDGAIGFTEMADDDPSFTSATDEQLLYRTMLLDTTRGFVFVNAVRIGIRIEFSSQDNLLETMTKLSDAMDAFLIKLGAAGYDTTEIYNIIQDLRAVFIKMMRAKALTLSKEIEYVVPPDNLPTLVLAYNRYKDVSRCSEIFERNRPLCSHPGFLPSGETIKLLET